MVSQALVSLTDERTPARRLGALVEQLVVPGVMSSNPGRSPVALEVESRRTGAGAGLAALGDGPIAERRRSHTGGEFVEYQLGGSVGVIKANGRESGLVTVRRLSRYRRAPRLSSSSASYQGPVGTEASRRRPSTSARPIMTTPSPRWSQLSAVLTGTKLALLRWSMTRP